MRVEEVLRLGRRGSRQLAGRHRWDNAAGWYRLRYADGDKMQAALNLLSRHLDRIGLRWRQEDGVTALYVGVAGRYTSILTDMADDLGFKLSPADDLPPPLNGRFMSALSLASNGGGVAVDAYLINEQLFILTGTGSAEEGPYFPQVTAANGLRPGEWQMPTPSLGISTRPTWPAPTPLALTRADDSQWSLGRAEDDMDLGGLRLGILGDEAAVAEWLARLVAAHSERPVGLAVIDGQGDLIPRLLVNPSVACLLTSRQATSLDVNVVGQGGINPLMAAHSGDLQETLERWRWWFQGMGLSEPNLALLPQAAGAGVANLADLYHWLEQQSGSTFAAAAGFRRVLDRLAANPAVGRWLTLHPTDIRPLAERGLVLISCPYKQSWPRLQALRGVLGLVADTSADLVLHQVPLSEADWAGAHSIRIATSNQNLGETVVLTRCARRQAEEVIAGLRQQKQAKRPPQLSYPALVEYVQQLGEGEALVMRGGHLARATWQ